MQSISHIVALLFGPLLLEWHDHEFCYPRRIASSQAILAVDMPDLNHCLKLSVIQMCELISSIIVDWNMNMSYCAYSFTGKKANEGNCQDFCNDILSRCNIKPSWKPDTALGRFIGKMQERGNCEQVYEPTPSLKAQFQLKDAYTFASHVELDEFVNWLNKQCGSKLIPFKIDFADDYKLLKSFDRAYWCKYMAKEDATNAPLMDKTECQCAFGNPTTTNTLALKR